MPTTNFTYKIEFISVAYSEDISTVRLVNGYTGISIVNIDCYVGADDVDLLLKVRTRKSNRPGIGGILTFCMAIGLSH